MTVLAIPGVRFEHADAARGGIAAARTDIAGFVGIAERGPLDEPVAVSSWEQFEGTFGGFLLDVHLAYAVKAFFENGGRRCYVVRVAAPMRRTETRGGGALQPEDGSASLVASTAGFVPGAVVTARAKRETTDLVVREVDGGGGRLIWETPLPVTLWRRPLEFETGVAAARGEVATADGDCGFAIEARSPGVWGDGVVVRLSGSVGASTRSTEPQPTDRTSSALESLAGLVPGSIVRVSQAGIALPRPYRVVAGVDSLRALVRWDDPLDRELDLALPIHFETVELGLIISVAGRAEEVFSDLSPVPAHPRFVATVIELESRLIRVRDVRREATLAARLRTGAALLRTPASVELRGGRDGTAALRWTDIVGEPGVETRGGLRSLELVDEVAIVAVPDAHIRPRPPLAFAPAPLVPEPDRCLPQAAPESPGTLPPPRPLERIASFGATDVARIQQSLVAHCADRRDRLALLDPPMLRSGAPSGAQVADVQTWRARFDSPFAALYYPWLLVNDPLKTGGSMRAVPPSGHVAGTIARVDRTVGVHKPPANEELRWAQATTAAVGPELQGLLNPLGVNCIRVFPGRGIRIYGARTVSNDPSWRYVNVRRLLSMIEESVEEAVQWTVFEPNDVYLRETLRLAISSFLERMWAVGALSGAAPEEAFFVKCDDENNPAELAATGQLLAEVGVAPVQPAEFIVFRIGRTEDELELVEV